MDSTAVAEFYRLEPKVAGHVPFVCIKGHLVAAIALVKHIDATPQVWVALSHCRNNIRSGLLHTGYGVDSSPFDANVFALSGA
jgi:hypothetical protein